MYLIIACRKVEYIIDSIKNNKFFKVLEVSTMSSGKSTCINSIIGKDRLLYRGEWMYL